MHKTQAIDPEPLKREQAKPEKEVKRLTDALAEGELERIHDAVRARRARLEHIQGTLSGLGAVKGFNLEAFAEKVAPIIADWRAHLQKNKDTASQVLRKAGSPPADRHAD